MLCPSCAAEFDGAAPCPHCGAGLSSPTASLDATAETLDLPEPPSLTPVPGGLPSGTLLASRYRVVRYLRSGGMGTIYQAEDLKLNVQVALKFLRPKHANDPRVLELLLNEVRLAREIAHPNVCRLFDIGEIDGQHFLSMEYVEGEDLASLLRRIGRLPHDKAITIGLEICHGLEAAHRRGIVHRDLKPSNLMIENRPRQNYGLRPGGPGQQPR